MEKREYGYALGYYEISYRDMSVSEIFQALFSLANWQ